jgi:hypothetical protein
MEKLGVDDWADQDLLTKEEARERLTAEITRTKSRLAALKSPDDRAEVALLERRLVAMESVCSEYETYLEE